MLPVPATDKVKSALLGAKIVEPTANLDSKSTEDLLDIMARLNKEEGITFIFSTHDQRVIDRARRVITMEDGKIITDENRN